MNVNKVDISCCRRLRDCWRMLYEEMSKSRGRHKGEVDVRLAIV
jgi:hypothetical protein